jgi:hypothetical protein
MHHRRRRRVGGQAIPEFAIVIPLLLLLLFAFIDFSRLLFTYMSMTNGSRELGRVLALTWEWGAYTDATKIATATSNSVQAFNNLSIFAGPATQIHNFSVSPGSGTISCSSMSASGCGIQASYDYSAHALTLTPYDANATGGPATYTLSGTTIPYLSSLNVTADGDYAALMMVPEGTSLSNQFTGYLQICPLPITTSCTLSNTNLRYGGGGVIEIDTSYTFNFSPLFQNKLSGIIDASFMRQFSVLTTSTRTTGE